MKASFRLIHRRLGPWLVLPLLLTLLTGLIYRTGRTWFGMSKETGGKILHIHTGEWAGEIFSLIYVGITGLCLLAMIFTGARLLFQSRSPLLQRRLHRMVGLVVMLPLGATAATGIAYHFGEVWFKIPDDVGDTLMMIHEGGWLGKPFKPFYVILLASGLAYLLFTGVQMAGIFSRRRNNA
ncbi:MAG: PepSY domain-containing protein [Terrimicrobiaceae bacterium]